VSALALLAALAAAHERGREEGYDEGYRDAEADGLAVPGRLRPVLSANGNSAANVTYTGFPPLALSP
jgi:flagellar biosynthesis/type III secretory pathway protein FliH